MLKAALGKIALAIQKTAQAQPRQLMYTSVASSHSIGFHVASGNPMWLLRPETLASGLW